MKKYKIIKNVLLITAVLFLATAITFTILILVIKNESGNSNDNFYYVASVFAGLCIGLIPLIISCDAEIKHYYKKIDLEFQAMREDLNYFVKLSDEKGTSFVTSVVTGFATFEGVGELYKQFINNKITLEKSFDLIVDMIINKQGNWEDRFIAWIDESTYMLDEHEREYFKSCKEKEKRQTLFMTKLIQLLNKFELLCYNFDKNESAKKIFTDQIGKIIMYTYFCSLFFISSDTKTNQFPFIEKMINCLVKETK